MERKTPVPAMGNFLVGLAPLDVRSRADLQNPPPGLLEKPGGSYESILFAFYFSGLPWREGQRLLGLAAGRARYIHIADFSIAERNLELAPYFLARLLFVSRRQFWSRGGIGNFVLQSGLRLLGRRPILARMAQLLSLSGRP